MRGNCLNRGLVCSLLTELYAAMRGRGNWTRPGALPILLLGSTPSHCQRKCFRSRDFMTSQVSPSSGTRTCRTDAGSGSCAVNEIWYDGDKRAHDLRKENARTKCSVSGHTQSFSTIIVIRSKSICSQ